MKNEDLLGFVIMILIVVLMFSFIYFDNKFNSLKWQIDDLEWKLKWKITDTRWDISQDIYNLGEKILDFKY